MTGDAGTARAEPSPHRVIGIGASAGGLDAYTRLLAALPAETGLAFLLVPHLSPTHHSQLAELLARSTAFPVSEARDGDKMRPDHLYVLPPDKVMCITDGHVRLDPRPHREGPPTVIDDCLASLAEVWGDRAVGVVLSGTGSDGAAGLIAIKAHGGTTYAQDFGSAAHDSMPRSAVEAGGVDFTLTPEAIARSLVELAQSDTTVAPPEARSESPAAQPAEEPGPALSAADAAALDTVLGMLQTASGVDFPHYKRPTMARRVFRRIAELRLPDLPAYVRRLQESPAELETLFGSVLIHVTEFFREPSMYEVLRSTVIPALLTHRTTAAPIRVWVVGCATGEEAYSTAIVFSEVAAELKRDVPVKIFSSDVSDAAVTRARLGRYPGDIAAEVSSERLERFFVSVDGEFQVEKGLREMCVFARQDVTRDPPFAQLDIVICRNLLIYLEPVLQRRVLQVLHYALKPGGFLALGAAESVAGLEQLFAPLDRTHKVYLRRTVPSHMELNLGWSGRQRPVGASLVRSSGAAPAAWSTAELQRAAAQAFFTQYPSGSVLVTADLEIRHFQGTTSPYLEPPSGGPTVHLLRMAHPDLRLILGRLIRKAQKERREVHRRDLPVRVGSRTHRVKVTVLPVPTDETEREHYLVVFDSAPSGREPKSGAEPGAAARGAGQESAGGEARVLELEQELADTKEYLQAVIDQQDETHAELQTTYEASSSANEEFQSTNEELESTKEELQSVNEELTTVNEEMQQRNAELSARGAEVTGLLEAMDFPILLLTHDLRLQAFNATAGSRLRLSRTAIGRPIMELHAPLPLNQFRELVERALAEQSVQEREIQDAEGRWHALRLWPVMPSGETATAVVAALLDIGRLKLDVERANVARMYSEAIVETVQEPLAVLDAHLRIITANRAFHTAVRLPQALAPGVLLWELGPGKWDLPELRVRLDEVTRTGKALENYEVTIELSQASRRTFQLNARRITQPGSVPGNILLGLDDVTDRRDRERQVIEAGRMQAVGQLAGGVAHEINNQMTGVLGFATFLSRSDHLTDQERTDLAHILKCAGRAAEITRQLLTFSRRHHSSPSAIELNSLVAGSETLLRRLLGPGLTIEIRLGTGVGAVRVDQAQFEQVLVNLVLNARDAMTAGGRLTLETASVVVADAAVVSADARVPLGRYARLMVRDTGTGMDEATRDRLFEPFFTTKPQGLGTGLGLASVYGTVKQSGGFIWVESEVGRGATFTIDLPEIAVAIPAKAPLAPTVAPRGSETILVVEDDEVVREWLARSLRELGYTVLQAGEGAEALRLIEGEGSAAALVVSDVMMPGMGGVELRDRLADVRPGLPVLLISAYAFDELLARGIVDRATLVLPKPFEIAVVAIKIRNLLDAAS